MVKRPMEGGRNEEKGKGRRPRLRERGRGGVGRVMDEDRVVVVRDPELPHYPAVQER